jgi:hypothetical protein
MKFLAKSRTYLSLLVIYMSVQGRHRVTRRLNMSLQLRRRVVQFFSETEIAADYNSSEKLHAVHFDSR